jgi:hypothetical protein
LVGEVELKVPPSCTERDGGDSERQSMEEEGVSLKLPYEFRERDEMRAVPPQRRKQNFRFGTEELLKMVDLNSGYY